MTSKEQTPCQTCGGKGYTSKRVAFETKQPSDKPYRYVNLPCVACNGTGSK